METTANPITNLREKAAHLAEQESWIRHGTKQLMQLWEEQTGGCERLLSDVVLYDGGERCHPEYGPYDHSEFVLSTGMQEITWKARVGYDVDSKVAWWDYLAMRDLRKALALLPKAMAEIGAKMDATDTKNQAAIAWLESVLGREI
jgi:hypothetical protein